MLGKSTVRMCARAQTICTHHKSNPDVSHSPVLQLRHARRANERNTRRRRRNSSPVWRGRRGVPFCAKKRQRDVATDGATTCRGSFSPGNRKDHDKQLSSLDKRIYLQPRYLRRTYHDTSPFTRAICQHSEHNGYTPLRLTTLSASLGDL